MFHSELIIQHSKLALHCGAKSGGKMAKKSGSVMVVGAGIAGMQASLDLANSDYNVYLVEQGPTIGGLMARLDKTFPTNDCTM
jgi:heterodisulfide reductase subunit A-like polyferredoxin